MSVESQVILAGHVTVEHIVKLLKAEISGPIVVRDMPRSEYKVIEFQKVDGSWSALNLFLQSWAADDYADAFQGPSTFLTVEYNPQNFNLIRSIAAAVGGFARKTEAEPWVELESARA
jgi:hypothetical protein